MRFFIELKYNGAAYFGWQRQNDVKTVQGTIERGLTTLLRSPIEIVGAGRTDTGVNASYYVAHFDLEQPPKLSLDQLIYKLNIILPQDVAIINIAKVAPTAHARFDATQREYTYFIEREKNPFTRHSSWQYYVDLDIDKMNQAAQRLIHHKDFTSFAKLNSNNKNNLCEIYYAQWSRTESGAIHFKICANRFLRNMVRAIVGTLVDVGRGKYSVEQFEEIIASRDLSRSSAGAPAQGLFLSQIRYPYQW
ncbi:MAG: tRNA pseudouridine(38-40) synthase TruA [Rikenellaceae bacterium]